MIFTQLNKLSHMWLVTPGHREKVRESGREGGKEGKAEWIWKPMESMILRDSHSTPHYWLTS